MRSGKARRRLLAMCPLRPPRPRAAPRAAARMRRSSQVSGLCSRASRPGPHTLPPARPPTALRAPPPAPPGGHARSLEVVHGHRHEVAGRRERALGRAGTSMWGHNRYPISHMPGYRQGGSGAGAGARIEIFIFCVRDAGVARRRAAPSRAGPLARPLAAGRLVSRGACARVCASWLWLAHMLWPLL